VAENVSVSTASSARAEQPVEVVGVHVGLRRGEEPRSDPRGIGAGGEHGRHTACRRDPAGSDDRHLHGVEHLVEQG
jgi:hypothetical protein